MKYLNFLPTALVAGAASLWLVGDGVSAQQQPPNPDQVQKNVQKHVEGDVQTEADVQAEAKARSNDRTQAQPDADVKGRIRANADRQGDARIGAQSDSQLGVQFDDRTSDALTISSANESGLAARAGLREGDRIVSINGRRFNTSQDIDVFLDQNRGQRLPITYIRDGRRYSTDLVWNDNDRSRKAQRIRGDSDNNRRVGLLGTSFRNDAQGVVLHNVRTGSSAHQAGLRSGDRIVCFNGWSYRNADQFTRWVNRFPKGQALPVTYRRDGRLHSTRVTLADPDSRTFAESRGEMRDDRGRRMPPAPGELRDAESDEGEFEGRRRAAFRPNFDEMSRAELQREVERLSRENERMRRDLDGQRRNRGPETPDAEIDGETDIDVESGLNRNNEIDAEADVDADAQIEGESDLDVETDVEVDADENLETPLIE